MALYRNGYFYHTPKDATENISIGTLQHFGENILKLIFYFTQTPASIKIQNQNCIKTEKTQENQFPTTYFDICGKIMIKYNKSINTSLTIIILTTYLINIYKNKNFLQNLKGLIHILLFLFSSIVFPLCFALFIDKIINKPMLWFQSPLFVILLYFPMSICGILLCSLFLSYFKCLSLKSNHFYSSCHLFWLILCFIANYYQIGLNFLFISFALCNWIVSIFSNSILSLLIFSFPFLILFDIFYQFLETLLPISGRAGLIPIEVIISCFCGILAFLIQIPMISFTNFDKRKFSLLCSLFSILFLVFLISCCSIYSIHAPKRVFVEHMNDLDSKESYLLFVPADNVPFYSNEMPFNCFPQVNLSHFHSPLPTIPSLKPFDGRRWEMNAEFIHSQNLPILNYENDGKEWKFSLSALHAFSTEIWLSSVHNIVDTTLLDHFSDINLSELDADMLKIRLFDGKGENDFNFSVIVSNFVKVEIFFTFLNDNPSSPINQVINNLPSYFTSVGCETFKKTLSIN